MRNLFKFLLIAVSCTLSIAAIVDLNDLFNYEIQETPTYVSNDNTPIDNVITDKGATLGRVLFYDKNLSINSTISCASCHQQEFAFGDTALASVGVNGVTKRHSMRLVNARYSDEEHAFWDERADSFEEQATGPIQDHVEMGFSGTLGDPGIDSLFTRLESIEHYNVLFEFVYGDLTVTEERIQKAIAQFVRSIQSFDSPYDIGRSQVETADSEFPNYTPEENMGKDLFLVSPQMGGAGCFRCHLGSEFSMIPDCDNNGVIGVIAHPDSIDLTVTKAPSLRDLVNPEGIFNGPFMHDGSLSNLMDVVNHYNDLEEVPENTNLHFHLQGEGNDLDLSLEQRESLVAFLRTLTGENIYTDEKLSDPFESNGDITIIPSDPDAVWNLDHSIQLDAFPNPCTEEITVNIERGFYQLIIYNEMGTAIKSMLIQGTKTVDMTELSKGIYIIEITNLNTSNQGSKRIVKR